MQFFNKQTHIKFMSKRWPALVFSSILLIVSIGSLITQGLTFGIDFTGGTMIELGYQEPANLDNIRSTLQNGGYPQAVVQNFGSIHDVLVRLPIIETENMAEISNNVVSLLQVDSSNAIDVRRVEFVGPQVGDDLTEQGGLAVLYALIGILIYVAFRFEYRFAIASVAALVHDVIITLGFFSITHVEFDLTVLAAVLAIIGYSLNDTIVVFDRVREGFLKARKASPQEVIDSSLNETLSRTLMTSFTTLLVVFALFVLGGEVIHSFAEALLLGIMIGTYSSIYVASSAVLFMGVSKEDLLPPVKESDQEIGEDGSQV
ncbi:MULTISPECIES: protein translocase subunit SecF [Methylophaga]|jgi:preprotein translocase subunit SecF|uniref:Protein-export membrane protein SecF n=1 Tax=Methylophaga marina TaxID=45495 RepID=A0ABN0TSU5_9GAMM|nr:MULTISPECIES: protein translocase subunit SecF [Methylophaga]MAX52861.1 protein translocase subunit SecF [Methylophaga sp.]BDZ73331.1 protein-export membrane protein SecF [Methylophaga marina]|tara:strand:- start:5545 stop:6495 length:951 start_codon:yes stop_codon:yes gene_type:complete